MVEDPAERDWIRRRLAPLIGAGGRVRPTCRARSCSRRGVGSSRRSPTRAASCWSSRTCTGPTCPMLEFIEHLIDAGERPFMVVCAARPELYDRYPQWGEGRRNAIRLSLPPLTDSETAVLISSLLERAVLPADDAVRADRALGREPAVRRGVHPAARRPRADRPRAATTVRSRSCTTSRCPSRCSC